VTPTTLHRKAMAFADEAAMARRRGDTERARALTRNAFDKEKEAALLIEFEPSRSVLLRSAAALALECGETRNAERLIRIALAGNPPEHIAEELRGLAQDAAIICQGHKL